VTHSKRGASVVVVDANVLITLIQSRQLHILSKLPGYKFVVVPEVVAEITFSDQAVALKKAINAGILEVVTLTSTEEASNFTQLRQRLGAGESACIAIAEMRGWFIASDEKRRFMTIASNRLRSSHILTIEDIHKIAHKHDISLA
jgi:predicted nucleic acid-binding protein